MIYVDDPVWPYGRMKMCHMVADSLEELHDFAELLGLKRQWFQNKKYPHYDISKSKREWAVRMGAIELDNRAMIRKCRELKNN